MRYVLIYIGSVERPSLERMRAWPDVEVYRLHPGPDLEDQIDLALLNNLETPLKLVYVGGDEAKKLDGEYSGVWIQDGPNVEGDLLRLWGLAPAVAQ